MTSAVASAPIKVELIEDCSFIKDTDDKKETEKVKQTDVPVSSSGKNKATRPVLPELVIADTELFVKTLSDVVSDVLSQPSLNSPTKRAPSSTQENSTESKSGQGTKFKVIGTRLRNRAERTVTDRSYITTPPRAKRTCYKTPSPSPSPASTSSSDPITTSPSSSDPQRVPSCDPLLPGSHDHNPSFFSDPLQVGSSDLTDSTSPLSRPSSTEPNVKQALRAKIHSRTMSPDCHAESIRQSQLLSASQVKVDPENLAVHVNISGVHKQHPCINCGKVFSQKLHLQRHIKSVHYGIRDNLCAFCGKGFMLKSHLMEHIRAVHFKIKNHVCLFCDWKFNRVGDLNRHVKTVHTNGKKPRKRRSQTQDGPDVTNSRNLLTDKNEQKIIDVVSDGSDQDYSHDSSFFDQPLSSNNDSLSPSDQVPLSLTDRYLSDYKKRLLELETDKEGDKNGNSGSDDLEIQEDEIVLFPSN